MIRQPAVVDDSFESAGTTEREARPEVVDGVEVIQSYGGSEMEDEDQPIIITPLKLKERLVGSTRTMINILKGMIGPGCLSLPLAFKFAGLWAGLCLTFLIGALNTHCMNMLVKCAKHLCLKSGKQDLDYGHLAKKAVDYGPQRFQRHSRKALYFTNAIIFLYQMGVCSVQFVFMASNVRLAVNSLIPDAVDMPNTVYISILLLPTMLVSLIHSLRFLAYLSFIGNIFMVIGFVIVFQYIIRGDNLYNADDYWFHDANRLILYFGSVFYAFEGQAMILPMENEMKRPGDMNRGGGVMHTSMTVVTAIYVATGFFGYNKFGSDVKGSITLNMPTTPLYQVLNLIFVIAILIGIPLQQYVIHAAIWPGIQRKLPHSLHNVTKFLEYAFKITLILIQYALAMAVPILDKIIPLIGVTADALAMAVPILDKIIPLIGVTAGMGISLILPPAIHLATFYNEYFFNTHPVVRWLYILKDVALMCLGVFGVIAGLYANIPRLV